MYQKAKIRSDLQFNNLMESIIEVLKGVAATEYFHLQSRRKNFDEFEGYLREVFQIVKLGNFAHPYLGTESSANNIILITSDTGFLGELNIAVVNQALAQYKKSDCLTVVGQEGSRYIEEQDIKHAAFGGIDDNITYAGVVKLRDHIIKEFWSKKLGGTIIIYPHFVSFAVQKIEQFQLFPCRFLFPQEGKPQGADSQPAGLKVQPEEEEVIFDSPVKRIVECLVKIWIGQLIHLIFWESKLSEWAARVMHLEGSADEVKRQGRAVRLEFFRALHENSDRNIREIFSSTMALKRARWN